MSDIWYERNPGRRPPYEEAIIGDNEEDEEFDEEQSALGYTKYGLFGS